MTIKPLADRVVVKMAEAEETKTTSGIVLTGSAKEKPQYASVVAVGPGGPQKRWCRLSCMCRQKTFKRIQRY